MRLIFPLSVLSILFVVVSSGFAIEKPAYQLLKKDGKFELRKYQEIHRVTVAMEQEGQRNQAFRKLAGYIGKKNDKQQKISMTAPVIIDPAIQKSDKALTKMSFVVPRAVVRAGIPKPTDGTISLSKVSGGNFAVTRFYSSHSQNARAKAVNRLRAWIKEEKMTEVGEPSFAFYNPPWIPQIFRTNEVWIRVK